MYIHIHIENQDPDEILKGGKTCPMHLWVPQSKGGPDDPYSPLFCSLKFMCEKTTQFD